MQPMQRVQGNIVNACERRFLDWACSVMPEQVTSDHLTLFGVFGAVVVCAGYVTSRTDPHYLWLSVAGYVVHWFGDSLDGSLARYRRTTRPRYGYFLDHSVDALCIILMVGGMGLSPYVRTDVALIVVIGYLALSIHVFLKNHVTGTFQLSFLAIGPTELRIGFVAVTVWMNVQGVAELHFGPAVLSSYDVVLLGLAVAFLGLFAVNTWAMVLDLRTAEGDGRRPAKARMGTVSGGRSISPWSSIEPLRDRRSPGVTDATAY